MGDSLKNTSEFLDAKDRPSEKGKDRMMLISVAMCTYNGQKYLQEQLDSIAAQSLPADELVICDDGSTDATAEIVKAFAATAAFPVRLIQNDRNLGSTRNFEKAISLCRGEFIALSDQDDVWYPEKLARLSAPLLADAALGGAFSDAELIDENARLTGKRLWAQAHFFSRSKHAKVEADLSRRLLKNNVVTGATLMFRADLRSTFVPIEPSWTHDGWIAWMLVLYSHLIPVYEPLVKYRIHGSQQIGVGPTSLRGRLDRTRHTGHEQYLLEARQFEAVVERWIRCPGDAQQARLKDLEGKVRYSYLRAGLPGNRLLRAYLILRNSRAYQRYARGLLSMVQDVLL